MFFLFHLMHHLWHEMCQLLQSSSTQMIKLLNYITVNQSSVMKLKCFIKHYVLYHNQTLQLKLTKYYKVGILSWLLMFIYQNDKIYLSNESVAVLSSIKCVIFNYAYIKCVNFKKTQYWLETVLILYKIFY